MAETTPGEALHEALNTTESSEEPEQRANIILFIFLTLLLGVFVRHILSKFVVPYTSL